MPENSGKLRALVKFKEKMEKKIEELDSERKELQATLETVNSILLDKGFKRGDLKEVGSKPEEVEPPIVHVTVKEEKPMIPRVAEPESVIPLKTIDDEPLALIYVDKQTLHILPDESKKFSVNTPPFTNFLVERVLSKIQEKDKELVRMGQLASDKMFAYNIVREGDLIREILIRNVDAARLKELRSSIRWTLEKMYEKTKS